MTRCPNRSSATWSTSPRPIWTGRISVRSDSPLCVSCCIAAGSPVPNWRRHRFATRRSTNAASTSSGSATQASSASPFETAEWANATFTAPCSATSSSSAASFARRPYLELHAQARRVSRVRPRRSARRRGPAWRAHAMGRRRPERRLRDVAPGSRSSTNSRRVAGLEPEKRPVHGRRHPHQASGDHTGTVRFRARSRESGSPHRRRGWSSMHRARSRAAGASSTSGSRARTSTRSSPGFRREWRRQAWKCREGRPISRSSRCTRPFRGRAKWPGARGRPDGRQDQPRREVRHCSTSPTAPASSAT